jgi:hypothetical protein
MIWLAINSLIKAYQSLNQVDLIAHAGGEIAAEASALDQAQPGKLSLEYAAEAYQLKFMASPAGTLKIRERPAVAGMMRNFNRLGRLRRAGRRAAGAPLLAPAIPDHGGGRQRPSRPISHGT